MRLGFGKYAELAAGFLLLVVVSPVPLLAQELVQVRAASLSFAGDPTDIFWHRFQATLSERSDTPLRLQLLTRGELGAEENIMPALRRGRVQVASFTSSGMEAAVPEFALFLAPYLFESFDEVDFVVDNYLTAIITELCDDVGIEMLGWYDEGWRNIYSQAPLLEPQDMRNYRMRALQSLASQMFLLVLDADVIPLPFSEVITGLQTGLIHGGEAGNYFYRASSISEQAPHFIRTEHAYSLGIITANKRWFGGLDEQDQRALRASVPPVTFVRQLMRATARRALAELADDPVQVHHLSAPQRDRWRARTLTTHDLLIERVGGRAQELYDLIQQGRRAFAQRDTQP
jgi:TRAP-type C4-dicarboxylate transport system substrate-binding protein